ncbi:DHA2 family efflux MFS transporter permease subunit [Sodalis sp. C49]|uniref:DHA2 family efflux MFS transporter permease subunit n=1 Tax=unclassified Sodalis (in: enterobacteria) TaxID=2636512 RepID=UPI003965AC53
MPETRLVTSDGAISGHIGQFAVLLVLCAGMFMAILDVNVMNIAIVSIQSEFRTTVAGMTWAVDAYNLALTGLMLSAGALADRHGARRIWMLGLLLFTGASLGCGLSHSIVQLIVLRLAQGMGAALFIPASFALMPLIWPINAARQRAIGLFGGIVSLAAAAGPVLGGFLVGFFSWRSVFLINIPIGLCGLLAAFRLLPVVTGGHGRGFDPAGQGLGIATCAGISYLLIELPTRGWTNGLIQLSAGVALAGAAGFILAERRAVSPLIPQSLFMQRTFNIANLTGMIINVCYFGGIYALSLVLQQHLRFSPLRTGIALLPLAVFLMIGNILSGRLMARWGIKKQMIIGLVLSACGYFGMACLQDHITPLVIAAMAVLAGGAAFVVPPMTAAVLHSAPLSMAATASAVHTTLRQLGSLMGVALAGLAFTLISSPLATLMLVSMLSHLFLALVVWRGLPLK